MHSIARKIGGGDVKKQKLGAVGLDTGFGFKPLWSRSRSLKLVLRPSIICQ